LASPRSQAMQKRVPSVQELPKRLWPGPEENPRSSRGRQQPLLKSMTAVQTLASIIRSCYGPHGRQKLLVAANGETVCTGHAAAILRALQLEHPAAQFVREAAQTQVENSGDGTAFVVLLTEALLEQAEHLLQAGLPHTQLQEAYGMAMAEVLTTLPALAIRSLGPLEDPSWALHSVVNTHSLFHTNHLTKLVAHVCWASKGPDGSFKPERIGVCLLRGGTLEDSCILPGLAMSGKTCGQMTEVLTGARVALFHFARFSSPTDLANFRKGSDEALERQVAQLTTAGINVVAVWGKVDIKALILADKHGIMVIEAQSRKEMVYLSEVLGIPLLSYLLPPREPGKCKKVYKQEVGDSNAVVFEWEHADAPVLTLVLRGPTTEGLRGAQQAVYQGIDAYFQLCQDPRLLPGAGATEMALARMLSDKGSKMEGPNGPAFLAFARALRCCPKILAENAGLVVSRVMAQMNGIHQTGNFVIGVGAEGIINVAQEGVWDTLMTKAQGFRAVAEVVMQLMTVDEIVVARKTPSPASVDMHTHTQYKVVYV
uniref:T-complex protein 1 subunit theta-like 2 n=1 Tax=Castor canadensis TaxID=51338 RepID=A0A8C0VWG2_CASCN